LQGGVTTGILPILLLDVQKGNDTYYYNPYAFNNMNRYEFVADKYVSLQAQQNWGGFPFKYFSFMRKLRWRSLTTFNAVWGGMTEANKIANGYYDTTQIGKFTVPDKVPYVETGVGISNILNVMRIDGIWRLTYRSSPNIPKFGIKVSFELKFTQLHQPYSESFPLYKRRHLIFSLFLQMPLTLNQCLHRYAPLLELCGK
jgi:hypothetical protein